MVFAQGAAEAKAKSYSGDLVGGLLVERLMDWMRCIRHFIVSIQASKLLMPPLLEGQEPMQGCACYSYAGGNPPDSFQVHAGHELIDTWVVLDSWNHHFHFERCRIHG